MGSHQARKDKKLWKISIPNIDHQFLKLYEVLITYILFFHERKMTLVFTPFGMKISIHFIIFNFEGFPEATLWELTWSLLALSHKAVCRL